MLPPLSFFHGLFMTRPFTFKDISSNVTCVTSRQTPTPNNHLGDNFKSGFTRTCGSLQRLLDWGLFLRFLWSDSKVFRFNPEIFFWLNAKISHYLASVHPCNLAFSRFSCGTVEKVLPPSLVIL